MFYGFVITEAGNSLLASMVAGQTLTITKVTMDKGTAASVEAARQLTAPIDPGPDGTSNVPTVEGNTVNMIVEYRSDLNGGLQEGFWIGGFGLYGKVGTGEETMIGYGSLGDAKQYVSAYVSGTAPDVRRYPIAITVTAGTQVDLSYPAEAWMTAEDVADYFNDTIKPELEDSLDDLIQEHNKSETAHEDIRELAQEAKEAAEGAGGRCILQITFESAFSGKTYTVTGGEDEVYTGTVPEGLYQEVSVKDCSTSYQIKAQASSGIEYQTTVTTGPYFGQNPVTLQVFQATLTVTTSAGASVQAVSGSNQYTATAGDNGTATLTIQVAGTYTVTATLEEKTAQDSVEITQNGETYSLDLNFVNATLESNSWATIKAVSDAGQGDNYWDVGDTKAITINGNVGNTNFSNLSINVYIIGFNHNSAREGNNRIHFKIGKIGGTQVALVDSQYGNGVSSSGYFSMNTSNTNNGGWNQSYHRRTLLGNTGTPTSPPANSLLAAMPADLRAVMKPVTKYSDNTGGGNNTASYVTSTTDYLFELAEFEYHGARTHANSAEQNYQQQYAYYQAGNSKVHYKHNATGTAADVACRSVDAGYANNFCLLNNGGNANLATANYSWGVGAGFAA